MSPWPLRYYPSELSNKCPYLLDLLDQVLINILHNIIYSSFHLLVTNKYYNCLLVQQRTGAMVC